MIRPSDRDGGGHIRVSDSEQSRQLRFEMHHRSAGCRICIQVSESTVEQIVEFGCRVAGLGDEFEQLDEVCRECDAFVIRAQALVRIAQKRFAKDVQFTPPASRKLDLAIEEQIEPAGEAALRIARAFRHRLDEPMLRREPRHDEARFGEFRLAQQQRVGRLHVV